MSLPIVGDSTLTGGYVALVPFVSPRWSARWKDLGRDRTWSMLGWAAVVVRVLAAAVLVFGPWTDEAEELDGWDVSRFQQIADAEGAPYLDHDVEYPPLTVLVAEEVLADDVVSSHRRLVVLSLVVDLGLAAVLARWWRPRVGVAYLLLGLPMVPIGLLRLDLWAALAAVTAVAALAPDRRASTNDAPRLRRDVIFAGMTVVGALIKVWPALLVAAAIGVRRRRAAALASLAGIAAGVLWLSIAGTGAIEQVTSLRGVTGWHLESVPGTLSALFTNELPRLEADAFRIGELDDRIVLLGRVVTTVVAVAAAVLARRSGHAADQGVALVMLASVATLVVTAPLVSPQFLLWLTPWAAMLHHDRRLIGLTGAAITLTAGTLAIFGPPNLDHPIAALVLLIRNGLLIAMAVLALIRLHQPRWFAVSESTGN